jgi:hypothetical protein
MRIRAPSEQLLPTQLRNQLQPSERHDSWVLSLDAVSAQRRLMTEIDTLWLLQSGDERPAVSSVQPTSHAEALAYWIDATIPCFFHSTWPCEQRQLLSTLNDFLSSATLCTTAMGLDLMQAPQATLANIIGRTTYTAARRDNSI